MTDNEIIKGYCNKKLCPPAQEIINRQKETIDEFDKLLDFRDKQIDIQLAEIDKLKKENDDLFNKLNGVMWSVDKWLDGDELNQDEVNRAITMREKTLQITEKLQAEVEKLNVELVGMRGACESYKMHYDNAQAEIERLKDLIISNDEKHLSYVATMMKKEQELMQFERIRGLESEIERLQKNLEEAHIDIQEHFATFKVEQAEEIKQAKSEARKEFADRLKKVIVTTRKDINGYCHYETEDYYIDNLLKEMESE